MHCTPNAKFLHLNDYHFNISFRNFTNSLQADYNYMVQCLDIFINSYTCIYTPIYDIFMYFYVSLACLNYSQKYSFFVHVF